MAITADEAGNVSVRGGRIVASGNDGGVNFESMLAQWQASGGGGFGAASSSAMVPLWRCRPKFAGGRPAVGTGSANAVEKGMSYKTSYEQYLADLRRQLIDADQASEAFLDLSAAERKEFEKLAVAAGLVKPGASPADLANAWSNAVGSALKYNANRNPDEWISPWEAVEKLGVTGLAGENARYNGYTGYVGKIDQTEKRVRTYTKADVESVIHSVLRDALGRTASKEEVQRYLDLVNKEARNNPEVIRRTGSIDDGGNSNIVEEVTGGIDPEMVILQEAQRDPEYAKVQGATTFFNAAMSALDAIV